MSCWPFYQANCGKDTGLSTQTLFSGKYTPSEWTSLNFKKHFQAANDIDNAQKNRENVKNVIKETDEIIEKNQQQLKKIVYERLKDMNKYQYLLEDEMKKMIEQIEALVVIKRRLENAYRSIDFPLHSTTDNILVRERRFGINLVDDEVQRALLKEIDIINKIRMLYEHALQEVNLQLQRNFHVKEQMEFDWSDKKETEQFDRMCFDLTNDNPDKQFYSGSTYYQEAMTRKDTWAKHTADNIINSINEREISKYLENLVKAILKQTVADLTETFNYANTEFDMNLDRLIKAKLQMENSLSQICSEIVKTEKNIVDLKDAVRRKDDPLKVAQTHMHYQAMRPGDELCQYLPKKERIDEVQTIAECLDKLFEQLNKSENALKDLADMRMSLEYEIQQKKHAIMTERDKCMAHRRLLPTAEKFLGHLNF